MSQRRPPGMNRRGPPCTVCSHRDCARLELELAAGRSLQSVADEFGLSKDAVQRHWKNHVTAPAGLN
jgi:hypothetical protein